MRIGLATKNKGFFINRVAIALMKKKKENRGGKRKGAGRKKLAPTKTVSFRVKEEKVEGLKNVVSEFLGGKKI